ncbi:YHS domain-containing protein [Halobacteria archaeon AArc-m2/3/4]|uniref:YHS domain-containing protein n=1 Tax=Natronoglomus mannanivorans TaxID=2979990 RepID=A0AAP2YZE1_9EURY|nr:YHS domain-containing protein [Halobacteria archaeon AArc-xg1-1]MCU4971863.1 YHS domain-containing protein [Halobacteria archaeon AArc-m2/3/4]
MVTDPVCETDVNPNDTEVQSEKEGEMYYFCSIDCREKFEMNPEQYIS